MSLLHRRPRASVGDASQRWHRRPLLAGLVRTGVFVVPIAAAVTAGAVTSRVVPRPYGVVDEAVWWLVILGIATGVLLLADRLARRFLPLASLLNLSLLFPARAPRRLTLARKVGTVRQLEERLAESRAHGVHDDAAVAAERILTLVAALQLHDRRTRGHAERVRMYTDLLVAELGLPEADGDRLRWAALLHDIGKLAVSADLLNKPDALDTEEWHEIRHHPDAGAAYCGPLLAWLGPWGDTISQHHERWDGGGYPRGIAGEDICYGARIVSVPDAYEVMTAVRPYRPAMSAQAARDELARCAGAQFDPAVVRAFLNLSISRIWWIMGPATWIFQLPFVSTRPKLAATSSAAAAGLLGLAVIGGGTAVPPAEAEPRPPIVRAVPDEPLTAPVTEVTHQLDSYGGAGSDSAGDADPGDGGLVLGETASDEEVAVDDTMVGPPGGSDGDGASAGGDTSTDNGEVDPWAPTPETPIGDGDEVPTGYDPPKQGGDADGPQVADDAATVDEGETVTVDVLANDAGPIDVSTLKVLKGLPAPLGSITVNTTDGTITYTDGWARQVRQRLTYEVCNAAGACSTATLTLTIIAPAAPRGAPSGAPGQNKAASRRSSDPDEHRQAPAPEQTRPERREPPAPRARSAPTTKGAPTSTPERGAAPARRPPSGSRDTGAAARERVSGEPRTVAAQDSLGAWLASALRAFNRFL